MAKEGDPLEWPKFVVKMPRPAPPPGQMSFAWDAPHPRTPTNYEQRLMILLGLKSLEELERVLSEPPNEESLEAMGPPDDLYALDAEDDLINDGLQEIEETEKEGSDAIFVTKDGIMAVLKLPNPAPTEVRVVRELSNLPYRILPKPTKLDRCNCMWIRFAKRGNPDEFWIYEELSSYPGEEGL